MKLCHQLVHSFVLTLSIDGSTDCFDGVYVSSDRERRKGLFLVRAADFIALCRDVGFRMCTKNTGAGTAAVKSNL